jgi:DNA/RNA-binding domain of Phe-tRNA-synthetase-like protein
VTGEFAVRLGSELELKIEGFPNGSRPFILGWQARPGRGDSVLPDLNTYLQDVLKSSAFNLVAPANIIAFNDALRQFGRNPNRHRVSSDALRRRFLKSGELPSISSIVDANNALSLVTGYPVGCYDLRKLGRLICLRLGVQGEKVDPPNRGTIDISNLPVLADSASAFGSPISDSQRSMVTPGTDRIFFAVYGFGVPAEELFSGLIERIMGSFDIELTSSVSLIS